MNKEAKIGGVVAGVSVAIVLMALFLPSQKEEKNIKIPYPITTPKGGYPELSMSPSSKQKGFYPELSITTASDGDLQNSAVGNNSVAKLSETPALSPVNVSPNQNPEFNNFSVLKEWNTEKDEKSGEARFAKTAKDGFSANIIFKPMAENISIKQYARQYLTELQLTKNEDAYLMIPPEIDVSGIYLLISRAKKNSQDNYKNQLKYTAIFPVGNKIGVIVLSMDNPKNPKEMKYKDQASKALKTAILSFANQ